MYIGKINLNKIDKELLFNAESGAIYCDIVIWLNDKPDQYGNNISIKQGMSKQDREAGKQADYIGNAKEWKSQDNPDNNKQETKDDLPF